MEVTSEIVKQALEEVATELNMNLKECHFVTHVGSVETEDKRPRWKDKFLSLKAGYYSRDNSKTRRIQYKAVSSFDDLKNKIKKNVIELQTWYTEYHEEVKKRQEENKKKNCLKAERLEVLQTLAEKAGIDKYDVKRTTSTKRFQLTISYDQMEEILMVLAEKKLING